ncbi:helix-turn-helix domain-containing protein [Burkholderia semiarida]|uniref:Helix-turn-helix domain-containing protein n=1 Tax=Burkholderia semiarida TaxID=2843303 RepID=A0ABW7LFK5_9BURK
MEVNDPDSLVVLQAFIDHEFSRHVDGTAPERVDDVEAFIARRSGGACAKRWLLREALTDSCDYRSVASALRKSEVHGMVLFLLRNDGKLETLVPSYGISLAHFRRLFRKALGKPPKRMLKAWRLARAVLEVVDRRGSITQVAMDMGYSSPSHFSSDFRAAMGNSLTRLLDLSDRQQGRSSEAESNTYSVLPGDAGHAAAPGRSERGGR